MTDRKNVDGLQSVFKIGYNTGMNNDERLCTENRLTLKISGINAGISVIQFNKCYLITTGC